MDSRESSESNEIVAELTGLFPGEFKLDDNFKRFSHSANQVFSAVVKSAEVVVKPFRGEFHRERANHEASMMDTVRNCGIPTLKPTALCLGGIADYLLTRYEPDITPLDQLGLDRLSKTKLRKTVADAGKLLGTLHGSGIIHGDFQIKNLFVEPNGEIGVMDLESAEIHDDAEDSGYISGCWYDLRTLFNSLSQELPSMNPMDYKIPIQDSYDNSFDA